MQSKTISRLQEPFQAEIKVPGDKSISHRSVILGSIANGITELANFLTGEDCVCTLKAFEAWGVENEFNAKQQTLKIYGKGFAALKAPSNKEIYLGNSGTAIRLLSGLCAALPFESVLTGDESLCQRPMGRVIKPLELMGADIRSENDGKAPLLINSSTQKPKLNSIDYQSPVASAQLKSCLLLAGLFAEGQTSVYESHLSRDHTELMLKSFGADVNSTQEDIDDETWFRASITGSSAQLEGQKFNIPSDISSAAFFMVAAAILPGSEITLTGVGINPTRTGIIDVLKNMNVNIVLSNKRLEGSEKIADITIKHSEIKATTIAGDIIPRLIDEIPVIAILAAQAHGQTLIKDAEELKVKESNRIATTINMLKAFGVEVQETDDGMIIEGLAGRGFEPKQNQIDSHGDHRLAMSSAIAALRIAPKAQIQEMEILQTEFVNTSFPGFFELLLQ